MANEWKRGTFTYDAVGLSHTTANIMNAFTSFLTQVGWATASWSVSSTDRYFTRTDHGSSDVWHYTGDGPTQKCGLRVTISGLTIRLRAFVENSGGTAALSDTGSTQEMVITVDNTAPNNYLLIGGEFGIHVECGRDGLPSNLGVGFIGTFLPIPEFYGAKDAQRKWSAQGFVCDLNGTLKFSTSRGSTQTCFITNDGSNRAFSPQLQPDVSRGTTNLYANTQANNVRGVLSHRKNIVGMNGATSGGDYTTSVLATFGSAWLSGQNNARYVISGLVYSPVFNTTPTTVNVVGISASVATGATTGSPTSPYMYDASAFWRKVEKFAQVEYTLTPWANITDAVSGLAYRVVNIADGGRTAKIAVEWPSAGNVVTITL